MKRRLRTVLAVMALVFQSVACPFSGPPDPAFNGDAGVADSHLGDAVVGDAARSDAERSDAARSDAARPDTNSPADAVSEDAALASCLQLKEQLKQELTVVGSCTVVVRQVPYGDNLKFQVVCGQYRATSEAQARAAAESETGLAASATALHTPTADDEYVFYDPPDTAGGAAAVSARTGLVVFGATLDSENRSGNAITHPVAWRPASALGPGCHSSHSIDTDLISAYDLANGTAVTMPEEWPLVAAARLSDTVLVDALAEAGYVFDLVVLYYLPLGFGPGDVAENILLLNGGWLE
jgi:hypothetical protein